MRISHGPQLVQYELSRSRGLGDKPAATPGVLFLAAPLPPPADRAPSPARLQLGNEIFSALNFIIHNETPDCNDRPDTDVGKQSFIATKCGEHREQGSLQLQNKPVCHSDSNSLNK